MTVMPDRFLTCLADTLAHEGGWSDHPDDPGGKTFRGVTKGAWERFVGRKVTGEELRSLTFEDIAPFYFEGYWQAAGCDFLPSGIDGLVFDIAVNSGPFRAGIILQTSCNDLSRIALQKDGKVGRKTQSAAKAIASKMTGAKALIDRIAYRRLTFYSQLRNWATFRGGWRQRTISTATFAAYGSIRLDRMLVQKGG